MNTISTVAQTVYSLIFDLLSAHAIKRRQFKIWGILCIFLLQFLGVILICGQSHAQSQLQNQDQNYNQSEYAAVVEIPFFTFAKDELKRILCARELGGVTPTSHHLAIERLGQWLNLQKLNVHHFSQIPCMV